MMFLRALMSDEKGVPDESAMAFLSALFVVICGAFMRAFGYPFPLAQFSVAVCALIPLYKAAKGDWKK